LPLGTITIISISNTNQFSSEITETSSEKLLDREQNSISDITSEKANFIEEVFGYSEGLVDTLAEFATELWADSVSWGDRESYYHDADVAPEPPDTFYDGSEYNRDISLTYSAYKLAPELYTSSYLNRNESINSSIEISANMDYIFQAIKTANPDFAWVYMGLETGIHRSFPWHGPYSDDYDPRLRSWYINAKSANGELVWSDPYIDASGRGLMISCSKAVFTETNKLIGVVAADLTIEVINQNILAVTIGKTGYAFLIDSDAKVVAHKGLEDKGTDVHITELEGTDPSFEQVINDMIRGGSDVIVVEFPQGDKYCSYSPINNIGYSIGIVVPVEEITEPIDDAKEEINTESSAAVMNFILIIIVFLVIVIITGIFLSLKLVQPIKQLTTVAEHITHGNFHTKINVNTRDEISVLAESFKNLLVTLRLGNRSYYKGDLKRALENYKEALALFETTDNQKGIGMCYNNIGNIYRTWGEYALAKDYFNKAIKIGKQTNDMDGLASRLNNMGILLKAQGNNRTAFNYYKSALDIDNKLNDHKSISMRLNNIGLTYLDSDINQAISYFERALSIDEKYQHKRGKGNTLNNLGQGYLRKRNYRKALDHLEKALVIGEKLGDPKIMITSLKLIAQYHRELGNTKLERTSIEAANEVKLFGKPPKTVIFVVDKSGSMDTKRINAVRAGAVALFKRNIYDKDKVGIIEFDDYPNVVSKPIKVSGNRERIKNMILNITPDPPFGLTAFYDSMGKAVKLLSKTSVNDRHWIVALTDGEDNKSVDFAPRNQKSFGLLIKQGIRDYMTEHALDATVVVLGAGREVRKVEKDLQYLCKDGGYYIKVSLDKDVHKSITEAFKDVEHLFAEQEEMEGYVPDEV